VQYSSRIATVTKETPKWLQAGSYAARLDRHVIEELFRRKNRVLRGLQVTQRASGATLTGVDISAGSAVVLGTTQSDPPQGAYMVRSTAVEPLAPSTTPAANRTDSVYLVVNDPNAGGPVGDNFTFVWVNGGTAAPNDSILLATIARTPGEQSIANSSITDMRPLGEWSWTVGTAAPTALAPDGDLYVQVT
jgi:hypothetical protein